MKTQTRQRIIRIIREKDGARPIELVRELGLTPQAIHRHLRSLTESKMIEARGRGPLTRYVIAGEPELGPVRRWCTSEAAPLENPEGLVCPTRDVFSARLGRLGLFAGRGLQKDEVPLVIAAAGEIGNNCFDHNLGHWRDVSGCWFETQATGGRLWIFIADRGQGVFHSLVRADPKIQDEQVAVSAAFERVLSGRSPESRGNGLKFVKNVILGGPGRGIACRSGSGLVDYGRLGPECRRELARLAPRLDGTATLMAWSLR